MARTAVAVQTLAPSGLAQSYQAGDQANGHQFINNGKTFLHVKCTGAGICTVTITPQAKVGGLSLTAVTVAVPATTGDRMIGPFDPGIFNAAGGLCSVDLSTGTGVTLAAISLP